MNTTKRALPAAAGLGALLLLAACAPSTPAQTQSTAAVDAAYPLTVENCGREVTIEQRPERIVGFDGAAETLFALGAAEQLAGYFGASPDSLPDDLAEQATQTERFGGTFPFPSAEQLLERQPDLVVAYGFGDQAGSIPQRLDEAGIPYLNLSEACEDGADHTLEAYFADTDTIAEAIGTPQAGTELTTAWREEIEQLVTPGGQAPSVVVYGNQDPSDPFVSGAASFVQDQLEHAGAVNAYADEDSGYLTPSWEDIASRSPDIILSAGGGGDEVRDGIVDFLRGNAALSQIPAVVEDRVITLDYSKNIPGPQAIQGIREIAQAVDDFNR